MSRIQPLSAVCGLTWKNASSPKKIASPASQIALAVRISAAAGTIAGATNPMFAG